MDDVSQTPKRPTERQIKQAMSVIGRLARGVKKNLTPAQRLASANRLTVARLKRWPDKTKEAA